MNEWRRLTLRSIFWLKFSSSTQTEERWSNRGIGETGDEGVFAQTGESNRKLLIFMKETFPHPNRHPPTHANKHNQTATLESFSSSYWLADGQRLRSLSLWLWTETSNQFQSSVWKYAFEGSVIRGRLKMKVTVLPNRQRTLMIFDCGINNRSIWRAT